MNQVQEARTLRNVRAQPKVRAAVGSTGDVLMIATAAIVTAADVDAAGVWLDDPVD